MKRIISLLFIFTLIFAVLPTPAVAEGVPVRYTVVFNGKNIPKKAADMIADAGGELVKTFEEIGVGIAVSTSPTFADDLKGGDIYSVGIEGFQYLPDTSVYTTSESIEETINYPYFWDYQWDIARVKADLAWEDGITGSHDTVVAVLDTGVAWNHPDLALNIVYATCYSMQSTCSPYPDLHWHGTHVAGTIAATGAAGSIGVGPNLGIASYNVFELYDGEVVAFDEALWEAMLDVASQGFDVINMSLGGYYYIPADGPAGITAWNRVVDYVSKQGVTIIASSGNGDTNLNGPVVHIPSDVTGVISVGATGIGPYPFYPQEDAYDVRAFYSNYGAAVDLVAPGGDLGPDEPVYPYWWHLVFSTYVYIDPVCAATASCPLGWAWAGGTSMASPHVAGAAGLVKDVNPGYSSAQVTKVLKQTAEKLGDRQLFGHGMLDVYGAVTK
jgi:subtilisin family serine protease